MLYERILKLESIELENIIDIRLNVGSDKDTKFRSLNHLSKGQQCTAILNLLTLSNNDPLLVDQPEDNLDNSFITNNLVENIRKLKINRQFIFATHNANIPVFGDAELIVTMENENGQGSVNNENLGSIDNTLVRNSVIQILEGGDVAFKMRKISMVFDMLLHSLTNQCYTLDNENKYSLIPIPTIASSEGFLCGYMSPINYLLRLLSQ